MLYDSKKHCNWVLEKWDENHCKKTIDTIYNKIESIKEPPEKWSRIENKGTYSQTLYHGSSGVLWAMIELAEFQGKKLTIDLERSIDQIYREYLKTGEQEYGKVPSIFLGETGILLLRYKILKRKIDADLIYQLVLENIENPTLEALWGAPGTMLAALHMLELTNQERWISLLKKNLDFLLNSLKAFIKKEEKIWIQDLYGKKRKLIGAGHGYFGNIQPILKSLKHLEKKDQEFILEHILDIMKSTALKSKGLSNWPISLIEEDNHKKLVQWCHGAPGVITSLFDFPKNISAQAEELLKSAGELTWQAGPLQKGVSLCHGTDGNGISFLQLFHRTSDKIWLDRARSFAMESLNSLSTQNSLFTGDLGLAVYLKNCIKFDPRFPILDFF